MIVSSGLKRNLIHSVIDLLRGSNEKKKINIS
jgi:hypothetical protein